MTSLKRITLLWICAAAFSQSLLAKKGEPPAATGGPCMLSLFINFLDTISCPGLADGGVYLGVTGAQGNVDYFLDANPTPFNNPSMPNVVGAGSHTVIAMDGMGCRDTVVFQLFDPAGMSFTGISSTPAVCNGEDTGTATASATGGEAPLTYAWQSCLGGTVQPTATATGLYAGCHSVTVTDAQGCKIVDSVAVGEPSAFSYTFSSTPVSCYNGANGTATVSLTGGAAPYQFAWPNGSTTITSGGLAAGFYAPTITDAAGCEVVALVQVTQPQTIQVWTSKTDITCNGLMNGSMKMDSIKGGVGPFSFNWSGGTVAGGGQSVSNLSAGVFILTITDANGCTKTSSQVIANPLPMAINATNTSETCFGDCDGKVALTVTFGAVPYAFSWSGPSDPGNIEDPQNLCPGIYTVTVTDAKGCTAQKATLNVASANPISIQAQVDQPNCQGQLTGEIFAQAFGGNGGFGFKWSNGANTTSIQNLPPGNFVLTVTDSAGCEKDTIYTISAPIPVILDSISVVAAIQCFGGNGNMRANPSGGTLPFSFKWNDANAQISQIALNLVAGAYAVTVTDAKNCSATGGKTLAQPAAFSANASATDAKCFGENSGSTTSSGAGGTSPFNFEWSNGSILQNLAQVGAGVFSVTVSDKNGCSATATATVSQPATAVLAYAQQTLTSCAFEQKNAAKASGSGGNGAPFSFLWQNGTTNSTAQNLAPGLFSVTVSDQKGCSDTEEIVVAELAPIQINVVTDSTKCYGDVNGKAGVNLISGGNGNGTPSNYTYFWNSQPAQTTILAINLAGGSSYSVTATDNQGCSGTASATVPSAPPIVVSTVMTHVKCAGGADGKAEIVNIVSAQPVTSVVWGQNAGSTIGFLVQNLAAGVYEATVTNANGCSETATVLINEPLPISIQFSIEPLFCNGDSTGQAQAIATGGVGGFEFLWQTGETTDRLSDLKGGNYAVTVNDANACTASSSVEIAEPNPLGIVVERFDPTCFDKKNGELMVEAQGGAAPFRYSLDGQEFGGNGNFIGLGAGQYRIFVRDAGGCLAMVLDSLSAPARLEINLGPDLKIALGDSIQLVPTVSGAQGAVNFVWQSEFPSEDHCTDTTCVSLMTTPFQTIHYWATATDEQGCSGKDIIKIEVDKQRGFWVPTGFTPNGDAANDVLIVHGKSKMVERVVVFKIFDRWGEQVFEAENFKINDETRGWDGLFNGKPMEPTEFVWWVEVEYIDGYRESAKGATMLIR